MPLQPGPFHLLADAEVAVEPGSYNFGDDALTMATDVQSNVQGWNDALLDMGDLAADELPDLTGFDADAVIAGIAVASGAAEFPSLDDASDRWFEAAGQLDIAEGFAPEQSWQDPPGPFVPPEGILTVPVPTVPVGAYAPGTSGIIGVGSDNTRPTVEIWNFTRVGAVNFVEGDTFEIALLGQAGQEVSVGGTYNGQPLEVTVMGTLDANGNLGLQGVMGPDVVGPWHEDWYFDGQLIRSFDFLVSPGNG
jgi:hypothetical protein